MNTYAITLWGHIEHEIAKTPGKAKYSFFKSHEIDNSMEFGDFLKSVSCKLVHKFNVRDLFTENFKQFIQMREARGIPFAMLGMSVEVDGKPGVIIGSNNSQNLDVCFDGESLASNCHPLWRIKYFDHKGKLIKAYCDIEIAKGKLS